MLATLVATLLAAVPTGNLVVNPGAETRRDGWTFEGNFTALPYSDDLGFPTPAQSASWGGGANFFAGGPDTPASAATQSIDVTARGARDRRRPRDARALGADRRLRGPGGRGDRDRDARSTPAATRSPPRHWPRRPWPTAAHRRRSCRARRPGRSRAGRARSSVRLASVRAGGNFNDGYVDNVSLSLHLAPLQRHWIDGQRDGPRGRRHAHGRDRDPARRDDRRPPRRRRARRRRPAPRASPAASSSSAAPPSCGCPAAPRSASRARSAIIGRYSTTTASGRWQVREPRAGTVTRVTRGSARVRDTVRRRTVTVRAGDRYVARRT